MNNKTDHKLNLRGLINIGVFAVIYFISMWIVGMPLGVAVISYLFYPGALALFTGIITLFFMAKVKQNWAVFLFTALPSVLSTLMGHTYIVAVHGIIIALIAEFTHRKFGFNSAKGNIFTHMILSLASIGSLLQIYLAKNFYYSLTAGMLGEEYAKQLISIPIWVMPLLYLSALVMGYFGGKIGAKMLKKHFKKAGIV